ncbi:MAG: ABC transporter permease [Rhodobacteraceae bacterium]|nr:ABC transporter permease [Paracoccaceae bacterium]
MTAAPPLPDAGPAPPSAAALFWRRFRRHRPALFGAAAILLLVAVALAAPLIAPQGFDAQDLSQMRRPPSAEHWFGTDRYGRDLFARVVSGSRIALFVAAVVVAIELALGVTLGLLAGWFGGWTDRAISALVDLVWAFPPLVLALGIVAALGPGLTNAVLAIAVTSWAPFARITRAKVLSLRGRDYVETGIAIGEGHGAILLRYLLPGVLGANLVMSTLTVPAAILKTSALSFLGLGAQPPSPDWGAILNEGREAMRDAWWIAAFPGLALILTEMAFNFLGDGLRDALDPREGG